MPDVVVTVPINFALPEFPGLRGLDAWCAEGDVAGEKESGQLWRFSTSAGRPDIMPGERVYVVCEDRLRGYAPLVQVRCSGNGVELIRGGGAVAITIAGKIPGFRGWRYRWWNRDIETLFPDWRSCDRRNRQQGSNRRVAGGY